MIPDFPLEKEKLMHFWNTYLRLRYKESLGFINTIPSHMNHEGMNWEIQKNDGSSEIIEYKEIESRLILDHTEIPVLTPAKIKDKLDTLAEEMARKITENVFSKTLKAIEQAGNTLRVEGNHLSKESFLQILEKMDLEFDVDGNWKPPSIVMHPDFYQANIEEFKSWEKDNEFRAKHEALLNKKRKDWNDRENRRKLVD